MSLYLGNNLISGVVSPVEPTRNIGQIIQSTIPLTDAGLHLLDGSLILGSGIYSAFVDYIASIYDASANYFCTEADWQTAVTTYGVCGKFVYDSVNNTVRLPKYNSKIYTGGGTAPVKGNGKVLGLTDGTNTAGLTAYGYADSLTANTNAYNQTLPFLTNGTRLEDGGLGVTTDGANSGIMADLANITTSLDGNYYIVIATTTKTDIQVDIDEVVTDLNGKADVDLNNVNNTGTSKVSSWSAPSSTYDDLTIGASGTSYTAPADGWFCAQGYDCSIMLINASTPFISTSLLLNGFSAGNTYIPVKKGNTVALYYNATMNKFYFIYAEGSKWEAS